jgi:hypothetical protein
MKLKSKTQSPESNVQCHLSRDDRRIKRITEYAQDLVRILLKPQF